MHKNISVAVATRHRNKAISSFIESLYKTREIAGDSPFLTVLHDSPDKRGYDDVVQNIDDSSFEISQIFRSVYLPEKSGLAELWNWCVMLAPTDWVLICNDDVTFNLGWVEYLEKQIATGKFDIIHLFHYGGMCIHKSLILKIGWFDENFRGGGFEDIDYQLRIAESKLIDRIDRSHDFIRREEKVEVGHFLNHIKDVGANGSWDGKNNAPYMCEKWGRHSPDDYRIPSFRMLPEIDWHPAYTRKYEEKYNMKNQIDKINKKVNSGEERYVYI